MSNTLNFEAKDVNVADVLFSNYKYQIPRYQRSYTWTEDQISEFWSDLISSEDPYFIGSLIFNYEPYEDTGYVDIIDGQQRLLTITILIAVLRDIVHSLDPATSVRYQRQDIAFEDRSGKESFRILPGDSTRDFFQKAIQRRGSDINQFDSSSLAKEELRIKKAYQYLHARVLDELKKFTNKEKKIEFLNSLRQKVSDLIVIKIQIENEDEAYEIFETTNARGVDLSVGDLLKNLIFKRIPAKKDRDYAKDLWNEITTNVEATGMELKKFIRYFWISKYSFVSEKHLFRAIKRHITDWKGFLDDLWEASDLFRTLLEGPEDDFQDIKHGADIYKSVFSIRLMNVSQCYVLFLAILRNFKNLGTDPVRVFRLVESFTFRYSVVCKLPGNKVERIYSKYAVQLENAIICLPAKKTTARIQSIFAELESQLKELRPTRELFCEGFLAISYRNSEQSRKMIKYILGEINDYLAGTDE